jgi:penicillin-binding protein 1A
MSDFKPELLLPAKRPRRKKARANILVWILAGTLVFVITVLTLVYTYYSARAGLIKINVVREMPKASILYDYQGRAFSRFFDENRIALPTNQPVPPLLAQAVVATEDRRFYDHGAIDLWGIARAGVSNFTGHGGRQGASTITQQLARNSIGQMQRTYDRKFLEIFLAHRIELAYTKEQILRYYLDRIYFGQGLYGAETTAYAFFGVSAGKLNLAQSALLAGMISSPNASSPWKSIDMAKAARDRALARMVKAGYITQKDADKAQKAPLALRPRPDFGGGFATSEVRRQLEMILDLTTVQQGGLKIFTTIDSHLQGVAENALTSRIEEIEKSKGETHTGGGDPNTGLPDEDVLQGSFFAEDPANGAIRAVVGSRDFATSQYNRAMQSRRQVGSTLKPLIYATAFAEKNYCPASAIDASKFDLKTARNGVVPSGDSPDMIRINDALVRSDDPAAVRMGIIIGPDLLNSYAHQSGVTTDIPPFPSSYLGACDLSLNELTGIYAMFADGGVWVKQHIIVQVKDDQDRVIYDYKDKAEAHRVFSAVIARQVTGMMQNVLDFGTGQPVRETFGFTAPAAGKTGTTNDYKDALFEGFTTHLVAGVWIGYDKPREIMPGGYGAAVSLPVWANVMKQEKDAYQMVDFPVPPGLMAVNVGGNFFGHGERYFLTQQQRGLLDRDPDEEAGPGQDSNANRGQGGRSIVDRFLDIFR